MNELRRSDLDPDPFRQFGRWFAEAQRAGVEAPEAMVLATATAAGRPSARMVLLKEVGPAGFTFHTNYESRKGRELGETPRAALVFYWRELGRQVRVEGTVTKAAAEESAAYFATRPAGGKISAWASRQSEVVSSRKALEAAAAEVETRYGEGEIPAPPFWGGYVVSPEEIEFWQHRDNRLHDRFRYRRASSGWLIERLYP